MSVPADPTPSSIDGVALGGAPIVDLMGVGVTAIDEAACVAYLMARLAADRGDWVVTPNLDIVRQAAGDPALRDLISAATLRVADGMPLVWAARVAGTPLPGRVAGSNLIVSISEAAAQAGRSVFLLGGDEGTAEEASRVLRSRFPKLRVAGHLCPPFGFEKDPGEMARIRQSIQASRPDIVFVAMGFPKQERLIATIRDTAPDACWIGVGISFSFVTGRVRRAPKWMQRLGVEWVHRLAQEPRRLAKRYLLHDIPFAFRLFAWAIRRRFGG